MAKRNQHEEVDLTESSVYGNRSEGDEDDGSTPEDTVTEAAIDRLEEITGGADAEALPVTGRTGRKIDALDASSEEEVDALKLDLTQTDEAGSSRDGTGLIVDDVAEERLAEFTEVGPDLSDEGAIPLVPGRDDTSRILREHHPDTALARAESVVEGNLDEAQNEEVGERRTDEGTAG